MKPFSRIFFILFLLFLGFIPSNPIFAGYGSYQLMSDVFEDFDDEMSCPLGPTAPPDGTFQKNEDWVEVPPSHFPPGITNILNRPDYIKECKFLGKAGSETFLLTYQTGHKGVFKINAENLPGHIEPYSLYQHEIASYNLSQILGIDKVPPTTYLQFTPQGPVFEDCPSLSLKAQKHPQGIVQGSVQYFVPGTVNGMSLYKTRAYELIKPAELKFFDYLIMNCDRAGGQNVLFKEKTPIYIDHALSFLQDYQLKIIRSNKEFARYCDQMIMAIKKPEDILGLCQYLPDHPHQREKLRELNDETVNTILSPWINPFKILDFKKRMYALQIALNICPSAPSL